MIYAIMPVKNEAGRYLFDTLGRLRELGVQTLVCDDGSTDDTVAVAEQFSMVSVVHRPEGIPSFLQHEGYFRQWCWSKLAVLGVQPGDWVASVDADEFLTGLPGGIMERDDASDVTALAIKKVEMWGMEDGQYYKRVDGFWGLIEDVRFARWQDRQPIFPDRKMGSGCVPMYAMDTVVLAPWINLLHFGYMRPEDRREKHRRYTEHAFGHNPRHIDSILQQPKLEPYKGWKPSLPPA